MRYGKTKTEFKHFTVLADGIAGDLVDGFDCKPGNAWMSIKTWSKSADESSEMIQFIARQIGFEFRGKIEIYKTEPIEPPREEPFGYGINFKPYDSE
ncbi:hypothetical protein [Formosa algae]|uniref:hypothetical protein n=1 Tax=Formosa algae TaxID=225843 RepID=UPI001C0EED70|nr:hypothetical protein [Formosa algae]